MIGLMPRPKGTYTRDQLIDDAAFAVIGSIAILGTLVTLALLDNTDGLVFSIVSPWT